MQEIIKKAEVLIEALPYIRAFADKTLVIKYGGQAMVNDELKKSVIIDIILLKYIGLNPILVHGGGAEVTRLMEKVGKEAEFVNGLRVTDKETIELVEMVLVGKINKEIVGLINQYGGKAVGLSGKDSNLIIAQKRPPESMIVEGEERIVDLGYVGDIVQINPEVIHILSGQGY
ncbi:MAG: acetylglutamate kinase, partial [Candidatus Contubernalis sp.]|nr:acetylglutamate kinase [Candidatus Contubernalis sp.]